MNHTHCVALLGSKGGPAIRPGSSMPTSSLLCLDGHAIVVDCGLGVTKGLVDQGVQLKDVSHIYITHLHSDHYLELGPLLHTAWTAGLKTPVTVWGPEGLQSYWDNFLLSMQADIELRTRDEGRPDLASLASFHVINPDETITHTGYSVNAMRVAHPPLVDCYALSFKSVSGTHVVFSGDTAPLDELAVWAKGCDLLIHEAMLEAALPALFDRIGNTDDRLMKHWLRSHTFAHDAARIATTAEVGALALHHLLPADDPNFGERHWRDAVKEHWTGELHIASDGLVIPLPNPAHQEK
jgi:ribonuclease BN (tRNA processing enzyme)